MAVLRNRGKEFSASQRVRVRVTLQLTVSQSVSLGVEPNLGLLTRDLFFFWPERRNNDQCFLRGPCRWALQNNKHATV
jgi:hypothetical protein